MIKQTIFFLGLLIGLFLVSCTANVPVDNTTEKKIPIDSFSLSFKLNNQLIELKSPTASLWSVGKIVRRLYKVQNSAKDSTIFGYYYGYANANYEVEFGISRVLLVDTLYLENSNSPNLKNLAFAPGNLFCQFMPPYSQIQNTPIKYCGFYITIHEVNTFYRYTSYLASTESGNEAEFNKFRTNSSFKILNSKELSTGIYSDYMNTWFINCEFRGNLYKNSQLSNSTVTLTEGKLNGCF